MRLTFRFPVYLTLLAFLINGCALSLTERFIDETERPTQTSLFFQELDKEVDRNGVRHQAYTRIKGFPYLRANRYLESLKDRLDSPARKREWLLSMQRLDLEAREKEIMNLPREAILRINGKFPLQDWESRKLLVEKTHEFSDALLKHDSQTPGLFKTLVNTVRVPDDYSIMMRTLGLYPLVMPVVAYFTAGAYDKMRERNQQLPSEQKTFGEIVAYSPAMHQMKRMSVIRNVYSPSNRDAFGLPNLSEDDKFKLATVYAPVFNQDVADYYDKHGEIVWESDKLSVNTNKPTVYFYYTASLFKGEPILQINYVFWTAGRLGPNSPFIERGELDGITLRISLDNRGIPIMVDGMNNCGCYHFFIPDKGKLLRIKPTSWEFDPVIIDFLPNDFPEKPIGVRVTSGWHQVENVGTNLVFDRQEPYSLIPYHHLESIYRSPDEFAGMFDEEGIAIGSDRIEIYIFFSMGVPHVGAMKQRGHHPTKLIGRAHFDDPLLIDKNFEFK